MVADVHQFYLLFLLIVFIIYLFFEKINFLCLKKFLLKPLAVK
jgi:hypothetical protein